jgi:uncharacterized protein (TIGR03435 family)
MAVRTALLAGLVLASAPILAQNPPASQSVAFEVVSVKLHSPQPGPAGFSSNVTQRPDGSLTMTNVPAGLIIARAYGVAPGNMVNLPGWANSERYDVIATASVPGATPEQRAAMLKAMLSDRFKLSLHVEPREQASYDLVVARKDGTLGPGIHPIDSDCAKVTAERAAAQAASVQAGPPPPDFKIPPQCSFRSLDARTRERMGDGGGAQGDLLEGEGTMAMLANLLRLSAGRLVVDKTGLTGSYKVRMNYDQMSARRGPEVQPPDNAGPSVFVALPEQLGLKLDASRTMLDTLVIERLERPSEN